MGRRTDDVRGRGFLKQRSRQKTTGAAAEERSSSSYLLNSATNEIDSRKECCEEVVKYMSKLPGYLQAAESNVLNVGVLDWSRLQNWNNHAPRAVYETKVSSSTLGTLANATSLHRRRSKCKTDHHHQVHTASSNLGTNVKASSRSSLHGVGCTREPELPLPSSSSSRDSLNKQQEMPSCSYKSSSSRDPERVKSRRRSPSSSLGSLLSTMGNSDRRGGSLLVAKGSFVDPRDKETDEKRAGEEVHEARERGKQCVDDKLDGEVDKTVGGSNHQVRNIVLLRSSRKQARSTTLLSSEPPPPHMDYNKVAREVNRSDLEQDCEDDDMMLPLLLSPKKEPCGATSTTTSQEKRDPCSPSKQRFSFSLGPFSTSFTVKSSDYMRFACPSHSSYPKEEEEEEEEKHNTLTRLLLDPLLKSKGSENVLLPSKASQDEKKKKKQEDASRTGALFQLTIRNGIPLFQFVVDDDNLNKSKSKSKSRSILGATMRTNSAASSFKDDDDDSVQYCTFYSVNQVKKKKRRGSWLTHGHNKEKQQNGFVYSVMGEMRLCNPSTEQKSGENHITSSVIRESVLVEEGRKEEAAAVVIRPTADGETIVIIPGGVHSIPEKGGAPTAPLIRRWRSGGGCCDCGGWDVGCKLHLLLSNKTTFLHAFHQTSFTLFHQEESDNNSGPVLAMRELKRGIYKVEFSSFLSPLQAFFVCVTIITCASEEKTVVSKTTGKSSSPFAPPLSPVGRA